MQVFTTININIIKYFSFKFYYRICKDNKENKTKRSERDNIKKLIAEKRLVDFSGGGSLTDWPYKNQVVGGGDYIFTLGIEELPEMEKKKRCFHYHITPILSHKFPKISHISYALCRLPCCSLK